jgi:hypothetical protein
MLGDVKETCSSTTASRITPGPSAFAYITSSWSSQSPKSLRDTCTARLMYILSLARRLHFGSGSKDFTLILAFLVWDVVCYWVARRPCNWRSLVVEI